MATIEQTKLGAQLHNYLSQALATADPKAFQHAYLINGIVGEVGELFGQHAKSLWHGWEPAALQQQLVSEYGDIAWMTAVLIHVETGRGAPLGNLVFSTRMDDNPLHLLLMRASALNLFYTQGHEEYIAEEACRIWAALAAKCEAITGVPFQQVLDANVRKLADRAARGVLKGQGDNR